MPEQIVFQRAVVNGRDEGVLMAALTEAHFSQVDAIQNVENVVFNKFINPPGFLFQGDGWCLFG